MMRSSLVPASVLLLLCLSTATCFKEEEFKKCADTHFCKTLRGVTGVQHTVDASSVSVQGARVSAKLVAAESLAEYFLDITLYDGIVRLHINEHPSKKRFEVPDIVLTSLEQQAKVWKSADKGDDQLRLVHDGGSVLVTFRPFTIQFLKNDSVVLSFNPEGSFQMQHLRERQEDDPLEMWEESWRTHKDTKLRGPQGVTFDMVFPHIQHVYGIPEHATNLSLKPTVGEDIQSEPYRLFNLDVFEYLSSSAFGLYGSIPLLLGHSSDNSVGVFWLNSAEMLVDIGKREGGTKTQWIAESGVLDLFIMLGPSPSKVQKQYALVTGGTAMPQYFSLGYHQCRWNYRDQPDVAAVVGGFDQHNIPCDVVWLDIEHTDGKRYLTWDQDKFPNPIAMQKEVAAHGRKMVTVVDPHIKHDEGYAIYKEAKKKGYFVKTAGGKEDFDGWCWPGSSAWLDVMNPEVRAWWAGKFQLDQYVGSTDSLYIWNDMNEPSVFNGPEVSMPRDNLHWGGVEHRDCHNLVGTLYHNATAQGLVQRGFAQRGPGGDRPFVLSRAFFAGSQRVGPVWTGDNAASWDHLAVSIPMLLTLNLAGLPFAGADVGGFFGNPDAQLLTRWYQVGTYYPFFRGHAHLETARREPWLFGEETTARIRNAIQERYALLPYIYTLFHEASVDGQPILRPLWFEFPSIEDTFAVEHEFLLGPALLVAPVLQPDVETTEVFLPPAATWYDGSTGTPVKSGVSSMGVSMDDTPTFLRGGFIVPRKERVRRSSAAMAADPLTLVVALDGEGAAEGSIYLDDGSSFSYLKGMHLSSQLSFKNGTLRNSPAPSSSSSDPYRPGLQVERIVVLGLPGGPAGWCVNDKSQRRLTAGPGPLRLRPQAPASALVVRKPQLLIDDAWSLEFSQSCSVTT